jgi:hypothetical protein
VLDPDGDRPELAGSAAEHPPRQGSHRKRSKPRLARLINAPQPALIYRDMYGQSGDGHERPGVPL